MQRSYFRRKADSGLCSSLNTRLIKASVQHQNARLTQACVSALTRSSRGPYLSLNVKLVSSLRLSINTKLARNLRRNNNTELNYNCV